MTIRTMAAAIATTLALAGCATHVSRDISADGVAGQVIFPDPASATMKAGTFPNPDSLRLVKSGLTKDQLYHLLGRPHFREGFARVHEWDYLFHFRQGDAVRTCQYKVIFDRDYLARSFHWQPAECASAMSDPATAGAGEAFQLQADALFVFDRSGAQDITAGGRREIADIAAKVAALPQAPASVEVLAHTDRLGSSAYNLALSQARAETVRGLLIQGGVPAARIRAIGMGAGTPVTSSCSDTLPRADLIACLAPDRRVEIRITGTH